MKKVILLLLTAVATSQFNSCKRPAPEKTYSVAEYKAYGEAQLAAGNIAGKKAVTDSISKTAKEKELADAEKKKAAKLRANALAAKHKAAVDQQNFQVAWVDGKLTCLNGATP